MSKSDFVVQVVFRLEAGGTFDVSASNPADALICAADYARNKLLPEPPTGWTWELAMTETDRMGRSRPGREEAVRELHWHGADGDD